MAITDPHTDDPRRRAMEAAIRVLDLFVYAFVIAGGVFAFLVPPDSIRRELAGYEWLGVVWGLLLIVAGLSAFSGRFARRWLPEIVGTAMAFFGELIYVVILGVTAWSSATAWVALCMIVGAMIAIARRYLELQIFTSDPEARTLSARFEAMLQRRTSDVAGKHR